MTINDLTVSMLPNKCWYEGKLNFIQMQNIFSYFAKWTEILVIPINIVYETVRWFLKTSISPSLSKLSALLSFNSIHKILLHIFYLKWTFQSCEYTRIYVMNCSKILNKQCSLEAKEYVMSWKGKSRVWGKFLGNFMPYKVLNKQYTFVKPTV